jgi:HAD superfamily hydrolase (TIGR01484 family)
MKKYDGFVFDIDNTAVPDGSSRVTSKPLLDAFHALPETVPAIAATGRTARFALPITSQLELHHESVVTNGAEIMNSRTGELLHQRVLSSEQVKAIIAICAYHDDMARCCVSGDPAGSFFVASEQTPREAAGVFFMGLSEDAATEVSNALTKKFDLSVYISSTWENNAYLCDVNIGHPEAEKGIALRRLLAQKTIDATRMIGIGDGINDVSLFEVVGHRIAMADAHPTLLAMADEVIPSQSEDGLTEVVARFL